MPEPGPQKMNVDPQLCPDRPYGIYKTLFRMVPLNSVLDLIVQLFILKLGAVNPHHRQAGGENPFQFL